ncbi:hypothetical protein Smar_0754 [Staphylothermus marinus F1]|uniref:Uncharacterized protein n=1 Tax=Staphylothermus marinus (strain ATCC 43588 / DSM 3639 / JCM 9404 / F1) TaxID=399550 RepID=A3DMJ5_STAMF|nr:hypothetical protein [Staphylothermus marinus]ABN69855.1 hypothetical protein Smar_0754 [Staphylothermus marinus F1]
MALTSYEERKVGQSKRITESPVWEEALIQEFIYLVGHLNHSEQHLIEADAYIGYPVFGNLVDEIRELRKKAGQVMFEIERLEAREKGGEEFRTSWESIWCTLKHLTTALIHTDEVIEKILRKIREGGTDNIASLNTQLQILLEVRKGVLESLKKLISQAKTLSNIVEDASVRCREDLCLEEVVEQESSK